MHNKRYGGYIDSKEITIEMNPNNGKEPHMKQSEEKLLQVEGIESRIALRFEELFFFNFCFLSNKKDLCDQSRQD